MPTTTQQTATGASTKITMILANGASPPSVIHLSAEAIKPAADGSILVDIQYADALMRAGWAIKFPGGSSVPVI